MLGRSVYAQFGSWRFDCGGLGALREVRVDTQQMLQCILKASKQTRAGTNINELSRLPGRILE